MIIVFGLGKYIHLHIKTEQYYREADFAKILRDIVDSEASYKQLITVVRSFKSFSSQNHKNKLNLYEQCDFHFEAYLTIK